VSEFRSYDRRRLSHRNFKGEEVRGDFRNGVAVQATLEKMTFRECPMDVFNFTNAVFLDCVFVDCTLRLASFNAAVLKNVRFEDCDLDQATFKHASLKNVTFSGGRAEYAVFEDAEVKGVDFSTQLHGADLRFSRSHYLDFTGSNLWGATIRANCATFADVKFDRRTLEVFIGLLSKTAGNEDLTPLLDALVSEESRGIVQRIVRSVREEKVA
jgi:uncharacterized protein YjbI with pentapeptide repeats